MKLPPMPTLEHYRANLQRFMATVPKVKVPLMGFNQYTAMLQKLATPKGR